MISDRSIVYNMDEQAEMDIFISTLPEKDRYLYAAFDSIENVPDFLPGNYEWYGYCRYQTIWDMNFSCPYQRTT